MMKIMTKIMKWNESNNDKNEEIILMSWKWNEEMIMKIMVNINEMKIMKQWNEKWKWWKEWNEK